MQVKTVAMWIYNNNIMWTSYQTPLAREKVMIREQGTSYQCHGDLDLSSQSEYTVSVIIILSEIFSPLELTKIWPPSQTF